MSNAAISSTSLERRSKPAGERSAQLPPVEDPKEASGPKNAVDAQQARALARVGSKLGSWRLARLLGTGPVSTAYEAYFGDDDAGEHVVLRVLSESLIHDDEAKRQFVRAAYAANRFKHPRILTVTQDGVSQDGEPFVVRPWQDVKPLSQVVSTGPLGEREVMRIAEQVLDALEMAHAHGITHGAIAPNNILLTPRGSVRLCDFAARPVPSDGPDKLSASRVGPHTAPEMRTAPSTAPEVKTAPEMKPGGAAPSSEQSDIWSVGACLYYALTGDWPREDVSTRASAGERVSEAFASILDYALSHEPSQRYDSAYAMLGDVRRAMAGRAPKLSKAKRPVPSGSYRGLSPSMVTPLSAPHRALGSMRPSLSSARKRRQREWRGNVALVAAIVTLVSLATYVMVREKMADQRSHPARVH